jgi:hypothetical protein
VVVMVFVSTRGLWKNNIYKGFNGVVDEKKDGGENRGKGKEKNKIGVQSKINMKRFESVLLFWGNQQKGNKKLWFLMGWVNLQFLWSCTFGL